ncbi:hypothetical protein ACE1AT_27310 [Pelatocladus sp. BLCC-F211]|uniref:hypothetical protein n=1 Tax=Pelatocladus sp. BLCC-F211 TaxID=3342752 RepID=UPI0035B6F02C
MKTEREREELIKAMNVLLNHAYDSVLDDVYAFLQKIEDEEDEEDLKAYEIAKNDPESNIFIAWEDIKKEIADERKKDVA